MGRGTRTVYLRILSKGFRSEFPGARYTPEEGRRLQRPKRFYDNNISNINNVNNCKFSIRKFKHKLSVVLWGLELCRVIIDVDGDSNNYCIFSTYSS